MVELGGIEEAVLELVVPIVVGPTFDIVGGAVCGVALVPLVMVILAAGENGIVDKIGVGGMT